VAVSGQGLLRCPPVAAIVHGHSGTRFGGFWAISRPMPRDAPVTKASLPAKPISILFPPRDSRET
jgi:hypothetical protein